MSTGSLSDRIDKLEQEGKDIVAKGLAFADSEGASKQDDHAVETIMHDPSASNKRDHSGNVVV